jgi:hypothetical protein
VAPEEASQRIAATGPQSGAAPAGSAATQPETAAPASGVRVVPNPTPSGSDQGAHGTGSESGPIDRVVVRATAVKLVLLGDSTVTGASVEGPHVARREGGTLIIDTDALPAAGDFSYEPNARRAGKAFGRWRGGETVIVKVRPELPVEVTVAAGSIVATRLLGGLRFAVDAGSLKAMDCAGPIDGRVASGSAQLEWLLEGGSSRLRCELGSIKVRLDPRSDVTVKARAELGSVDLGKSSAGGLNASRELVVGAGTGVLDIDVSLGSAKVQVA